jgi:hypothetical protein
MIKFTTPQDRDIYVNPDNILSVEPHETNGQTEITFTNGSTKAVRGTAEAALRALRGETVAEKAPVKTEPAKAPVVNTPATATTPQGNAPAAPASGSAK